MSADRHLSRKIRGDILFRYERAPEEGLWCGSVQNSREVITFVEVWEICCVKEDPKYQHSDQKYCSQWEQPQGIYLIVTDILASELFLEYHFFGSVSPLLLQNYLMVN